MGFHPAVNVEGLLYTPAIEPVPTWVHANGSVVIATPGTYEVGFCILLSPFDDVTVNDKVNGWVMVTN